MRTARVLLKTFLLLLGLLSNNAQAVDYCTSDSNAVYCYKYTTDWGAGTIEDVSANSNNLTPLSDGNPDFLNSAPLSFGTSGTGGGICGESP